MQTLRLLAAKHMAQPGLADHRGVVGSWTTADVSMPPSSLANFLYRQTQKDAVICP